MGVATLGAVVAISALVAWILFHLAQGRVVAAEQRSLASVATAPAESPDADVELLHALRALSKRMWSAAYLSGAGLAGGGAALIDWSSLGLGGRTVAGAVLLVAWALPMVFAPRPVAAGYARARGVPRELLRSRRAIAVRVTLFVTWAWPMPVAFAVESTLPTRILFAAVAYVVAIPFALGLLAPAISRLIAPDRIDPQIGARLAAFSSRAGIRVGTTRVIRSRARKVANAAQVGWLPGLQSVVVTDYLLDSLTASEVDAVFAHELGHARCHHYWKRSTFAGTSFGCLACAVIGGLSHTPNVVVALGGLAGGAVLSRVQRAVAVRQEIAADDVAAALVGPGRLAEALDRISTVNALKRDTSPKWDRAVGHPGMAVRIARLRIRELAARPDAVPETLA